MSIGGGLPARGQPIRLGARIRGASLERWGLLAALGGVMLVGALLRLTRLSERVLTFDEGYTLATAQRSFLDMLSVFRFEANGTLNAILVWPLLTISEAEAVVRTPAVIAGLATIPAVYWTGKQLVGHRAALAAAAFVAVSPAMIGWSVYSRGYALANLFAVVSFGCLVRAVTPDNHPGRWRSLYVASTVAMAYSSAIAAVTLLPVHALAIVTRLRSGRELRAWGRAALALVAGLLPLAFLLVVESTYRDPLAWLWEPDLPLIRRVLGELLAGPAFFGDSGAGLAGAIAVTSVAIVLGALIVSRPRSAMRSWETRVIAGWAFFPPLLLLAASEFRPMLWGRYLGIVLPALALLVAILLERMPKALAIVYGACLASLLLAASLTTPPRHNEFQELGVWLEARRSPTDPLVVYPIEQLPPLAYYAQTLRVGRLMPVEEWNDTPLPSGVQGYRRDYDWGDSPVGPPRAGDLMRLVSHTGSILVITYSNLAREIPLGWASDAGCHIEQAEFEGLSAVSVRGCER